MGERMNEIMLQQVEGRSDMRTLIGEKERKNEWAMRRQPRNMRGDCVTVMLLLLSMVSDGGMEGWEKEVGEVYVKDDATVAAAVERRRARRMKADEKRRWRMSRRPDGLQPLAH